MEKKQVKKVFLTGLEQTGKTLFLRNLTSRKINAEIHFSFCRTKTTLYQVFDILDEHSKLSPDYIFIVFNLHQLEKLNDVLQIAKNYQNSILIGNFWAEKNRNIRQFELITTPYKYWEVDLARNLQIFELFQYLDTNSVQLFKEQRNFQLQNEIQIEDQLNNTFQKLEKQISTVKEDFFSYVYQQQFLLEEVDNINKLSGIEWLANGEFDQNQLSSYLSLLDVYFSDEIQQILKKADDIILLQQEDIKSLDAEYSNLLEIARKQE